MNPIPEAYKKVPMMFRAQVTGRSQLHYIDPKREENEPQDVEIWTAEWIRKVQLRADTPELQTPTYRSKDYQIAWRFITNGGQDDGMIRPVIGAYGAPCYPGSSMKGAFRQACQAIEATVGLQQATCTEYCGDEAAVSPGLLRFHGAYPINAWTQQLVDLVHPQQGWQVKTQETGNKKSVKGESAFAQVWRWWIKV